MKHIFVDVDTQNGFAHERGNLSVYRKGVTERVLTNIRWLVAHAEDKGIPLIGSVDSHAYDAWEFAKNGGPFPAHCVKGTWDWLKIEGTLPRKFRFVPMSDGHLFVGEREQGAGNRIYNENNAADEAVHGGVAIYFEKEVYSAFANPNAERFIKELVETHTNEADYVDDVTFTVFGYALGGFCVDAMAHGLRERGYRVRVVMDACQAIDGVNGPDGAEYSREKFLAAGIECINTADLQIIE